MKKNSSKKTKKPFDKKRLIKILIIIGALCLIVGLSLYFIIWSPACSDSKYDEDYEYDGSSLLGKWVDENLDEKSYDVYDFVDNDTVILTTNTYGIELQRLEAGYEVTNGNQLVVTYVEKDLYGKEKTQREYFNFSITKDGQLVFMVLDDMNNVETERVMNECGDLGYNSGENTLLGTWEYSGEEGIIRYTFDSKFTGTMYTEEKGESREPKIYYSYKGGTLYYIREFGASLQEQVRSSTYRIEGDTLYLSSGDATIEFTRR